MVSVVAMSSQRKRCSACVITDHHRVQGIGLPLEPDAAVDYALAHVRESSERANAPPQLSTCADLSMSGQLSFAAVVAELKANASDAID